MVIFMRGIFSLGGKGDKGSILGLKEKFIRGNGIMMRGMVWDRCCIIMEMFILGFGLMGREMVKVFINLGL